MSWVICKILHIFLYYVSMIPYIKIQLNFFKYYFLFMLFYDFKYDFMIFVMNT